MDTLQYCSQCGLKTEAVLEETPHLTHYGKLVCGTCGRFHRWVGKPDSDSSKYRRPKQHRDLVDKYSRGFCELCLKSESELQPGVTIESHHVVEFSDGGSHERDNVWILCTACHRQVHWARRYYGRSTPVG
jgi:5-methylcytosine-specific restriction endonuclease McrA